MYDRTKQAVESTLAAIIHRRIAEASLMSPEHTHLWESIRGVITSGGKRVRPYLTMVGYGEFTDAIVPVATAQELVHTAMLMHDDVIDQDSLRHGSDNIIGIYLKRYANTRLDKNQKRHYAYSAAVLAGDALLSEAYALILQSQMPPQVIKLLIDRLHRSVFEAIGGELMDVEAPILHTESDPILIYRYKTASYSLTGPLVSGAYCAGASQQTLTLLESFGINAGIGFQLQDDLLGVFGNETATGKSTITDLREAKLTTLISAHKRRMDDQQKERFNTIFGNEHATPQQFTLLKKDIADSGAKHETEALIEGYFQKAKNAVLELENESQKNELMQFIDSLQKRKF